MPTSWSNIRNDFPVLDQQVHGKPLVYLDSAATAQKPASVIAAVSRFYERDNSNVHRGVHTLAGRATEAYEGARDKVAAFVNAPREQIIWTRGTTEAANLVAYSWARRHLKPGDEVLVTVMEHHSNLVPWQLAAQDTGATIRAIPLRPDFTLDLEAYEGMLGSRTKLVAFSHVSNVLGTINPVAGITEAAHRVGAVVFVDAAQAVPQMAVDLQQLKVDFYAFSGHKMLGPAGVGVLYGTAERLEGMPPFHGGGEMIHEVSIERSTYKPIPHKFEAGTPSIADVVGLGAAVDYLTGLGMDRVRQHEAELTEYALSVLDGLGGITVYGPRTERGGAVSFAVEGIHPHDLATVLDTEGVAVRAGHHCAQPLMEWLGVPATARASFYVYNTREDVDALARGLEKAKSIFGAAPRPA